MGLIQRPVKQFGFRTYTADFAAAPVNPTPPPTNLYEIQTAEVDGDLDLIYALVNGQLDTTNLAPGANIAGTQLSPTANIVGTQLAVGAATPTSQNAAVSTGLAFVDNNEHDVVVLPALTTRGGFVLITGGWSVNGFNAGTPAAGNWIARVYRDATPIATFDYSTASIPGPTGEPLPFGGALDQPLAGPHVYKMTVQMVTGTSWASASANAGIVWALEFA